MHGLKLMYQTGYFPVNNLSLELRLGQMFSFLLLACVYPIGIYKTTSWGNNRTERVRIYFLVKSKSYQEEAEIKCFQL